MTYSNLSDLTFCALSTIADTSGINLLALDNLMHKFTDSLRIAAREYTDSGNYWQAAQVKHDGCEVLIEQVTRPDHTRGYCLTWIRKNGQDLTLGKHI